MNFLYKTAKSFTKFEYILWLGSYILIISSFLWVKNKDYLTLSASLVGATALIFVSKGNVIGQVLTVLFGILYGIISFSFRYYGEMITYLGMTTPIAIISIVTWLLNPHKGNHMEVKVSVLRGREYFFCMLLGAGVTLAFYYILKAFDTNFLLLSTISVFTSFVASYLTMRRSEFYAIAYALNDVVLIALWIFATLHNIKYLPMIICFVVFLVNDIYGYINWTKTKKRQSVQAD